jgi:hypothetical protein
MKILSAFLCTAACCLSLAAAAEPRLAADRHVGGPAGDLAAAAVETLVLMGPHGSGAAAIGTFENVSGTPDWNDWTSADLTQQVDSYWHVDTFNAVNGTYSAWCGSYEVVSCAAGDADGGYGRNYDETIEWRGTVADPNLPCDVAITANINIDTMPDYDYFYISCEKPGLPHVNLYAKVGLFQNLPVTANVVYEPGEYMGPAADEVVIQFRVTSDGGWDGQDCLWPNDGAVQLDDVTVTLSNGVGYSHDFEDGTLGELQTRVVQGVGDFAKLWTGLDDLDPCIDNTTPQVAFIDDGLVVPGTEGSVCIDWCYGPDGYVVNTTRGIADPSSTDAEAALSNAVESPPIAWENPNHDGAQLSFTVYRHENLDPASPVGIMYSWAVRSVASGNPADLADAEWRNRGAYYVHGPNYQREVHDIGDLLVPDRTHVQVQLAAHNLGWTFGWGPPSHNATPAPYFDNARLQSFPAQGPSLTATADGLASDGFPASGGIDLVDLGTNSVPFDAAAYDPLRDGPTDSLTIRCVPVGAGATLPSAPELYYRLQRNPLFNAYRTTYPDVNAVAGVPVIGGDMTVWKFDLPDAGFLFPGDRLHYFFRATQVHDGQLTTATLPADTTGFSTFLDFPEINGGYDSAFSVRALPSVRETVGIPGSIEAPGVLFWHDSGTDTDWGVWLHALRQSFYVIEDIDIFHTQSAASRLFNGLGARATVAQLAGYDIIIYTSGRMPDGTLDDSLVDPSRSPDVILLEQWLNLGHKNLLAVGDDLASDLQGAGGARADFLTSRFDVTVEGRDLRPWIDDQNAPLAVAEPGNPVLINVASWRAVASSCRTEPVNLGHTTIVTNRFDAVTPGVTATRLASWTAPDGTPGGYPQAAAILRYDPIPDVKVVLLPMDFGLFRTELDLGVKSDAPRATRALILHDILAYFGLDHGPVEFSPVPDAAAFTTAQFPNPFNPQTEIGYTVARPEHLTIKVFDLRGQLVRVLYDGTATADGSVTWNGVRADGEAAASGVYFYEARLGSKVEVGKMALIK